ncbi:basement membrane-specific heparan sulfate proteoglycan core protein-like [Dermacentor andersoni]|uniref:basement membrane-specific heparan sulfate proteoglycan core protein-like n=1 Tax=Dermacentor andersoni TaxID=34620 RepID=UPI003B3A39C7
MDAAALLLPLLLQLFLAAECARVATYLGDAHVAEGDSFFVACVTEPHTSPDWHKDGLPLPSWGHFLFHEDVTDSGRKMNTLYVAHAQPGHSGDYSCGINLRDAHRLSVLPSPRPGSRLLSSDVQRDCHHLSPNRSLEISCELSGTGRSVTWYKNDEALRQGFRERYVVEPGRLIIHDAQVSDAGTYTCLGSGGAGLSVSVAAPIAIEPMPAYQKARVNKSFSIMCNIDTQPPPRVSWFLGDAPLTPSDRLLLSPGKNGVENAKLTIRRVSLQDRNRYTCRAAHMHCSDRLASQVSTQLLVSALAITTNEETIGSGVTIDPSEPFVLSCDSGQQSVPVKWEKEGDGPIADDDARLKVLENMTTWSLTIEKPTVGDAGLYKCTAGADAVSINVFFKLSATLSERHSTAPSAWVESKEAFIAVAVVGYPKTFTLVWTKDGEPLLVDERVTLEKFEEVDDALLRFKQLTTEDAGKYVCKVDNTKESVEFEHTVEVKGKYAALIPFVCICVEVAVLCAIIYSVEKKALRDAMRPPAAAASVSEPPPASAEPGAEGAAGQEGAELEPGHEAQPLPECPDGAVAAPGANPAVE